MSSGYKLYDYDPSVGAAVVFAGLFAATSVLHLFQMIRKRTWYFVPFIVGGFFETFGYIARYYSAKQTPNWTVMPYVGQELLLLLAPSLFSASIYMILGRIIRLVHGDSRSLIGPSWLTKIFVTGDVLSFFIQSGGGGMMASAKSASSVSLGNKIIVIGLIVQLVFFGFFIIVSMVFHLRMRSSPTPTSLAISPPWYTYMRVLYAASVFVMVRSVYRVVEYVQGTDGVLQQHEVYLYVFDAVLMLLCCLLFNVMHPSRILSSRQPYGKMDGDQVEMLNSGR
ncbi:RTA1 domain-containing protein [Aspergillus ibericus CBS 121593]|uniref:Putative RTA1 domain protein n=1 Tax=Aspergillus ibericus CBS 121593 TaxID=1448316 RepID=A0A395GTZ4_9EURO|nr:putative RTA1 domain protein [Aspergillus ibericus CBS 121593]RAK98147.1 putative RTA1 domain protein [Aspergillus ibericus CBS 121593]